MPIRNFISQSLTGAIGLRFSTYLFAFLVASSFSCVSSQEQEIELAEDVYKDLKYYDAYTRYTNNYEVIQNFETKFRIHATMLTSEFRQALAARHQNIYADAQPVLGEVSDKTGFFVTLYVANDEQEDLRDQTLWNLFLETEAGKLPPLLIKRLNKKTRWKTYFPSVNLWTQEYLVLFDLPSSSSTQKLMKEKAMKLVVASSDGKVQMEW